jgi:hypothetical protein
MDTNLVSNSLEYFDINKSKYEIVFKNVYGIDFIISSNDVEPNYILFLDKNNGELFRSRYEIIGVYYEDYKLWTWGWAMPNLNKNITRIIRKLLNYGIDLESSENYLKSELITSRFTINNPIQLEIHLALSMYLTKYPCIYSIDITTNDKIFTNDIQNSDTKSNTLCYIYILDHEQFDYLFD